MASTVEVVTYCRCLGVVWVTETLCYDSVTVAIVHYISLWELKNCEVALCVGWPRILDREIVNKPLYASFLVQYPDFVVHSLPHEGDETVIVDIDIDFTIRASDCNIGRRLIRIRSQDNTHFECQARRVC